MRDARPMLRWAIAAALAVALSGCTAADGPDSSETSASRPSPSALAEPIAVTPDDVELSEFEQQLPLAGEFVSQATATQGTVRIERRADGSVWVVLDDFSTGEATDPRLYLKRSPLVQTADGYWVSDEDGYDIASIDPGLSSQEIEVRGAQEMPAIQSLTIRDYAPPNYPALGSAALEPATAG